MFDPKILEDFGNRMSALLANSPARDIEKNAKAMVSGLIGKLDVVTREVSAYAGGARAEFLPLPEKPSE